MDIGFVGLGAMGRGMARNLVRAGHHVRVWNRSPEPAADLAREGAIAVDSAAEAARGDAVVTMLADDDAVRAVYLDSGLLSRMPKASIHVNCSSISVALAQLLTERHRDQGIGYVSAPVFGRPNVAEAGQLNIVAAGPAAALKAVQPLLDAMGQKTWPVGDEPFRANLVKIGGNFMIAAAIEAMAEVTILGECYGVDAAEMLDIYTNTLFACPVYKGYGAQIAERRFEPAGFKLNLGLKDVRLALEAGDHKNVALPFGSALRDSFLTAIAAGNGDKDWSAIAEVSRRRAGLD